jgi:hypothetical protein
LVPNTVILENSFSNLVKISHVANEPPEKLAPK